MSAIARSKSLVLVAALAMLSLRALTPDGYMPGSPGSGLLYELCPDGMPAGFMQALAGGHGHHHHHHGDGSSVTGTEQCPIGHMLASALALDIDPAVDVAPQFPVRATPAAATTSRHRATDYRSRAPPA